MTTPPRRRRDADPLTQFRVYLEEIEEAVLQRDSLSITSLLRKRTATHLPRGVREELLAVSRMSRTTLRAPVRFLRFQHRMAQLAAGGERLLTAQTELQFESPVSAGAIRRPGPSDRRSAASDPKAEPPDDGTA
jgi:hypothetical protein